MPQSLTLRTCTHECKVTQERVTGEAVSRHGLGYDTAHALKDP